ncbi:MAG TPA: hypothetical protein VK755_09655 [Candidatus Acidoferrales bacterium]|jgi:hypothetical protein|nr:hypothetical protein [Candidatus Acidoferrales bacterium]
MKRGFGRMVVVVTSLLVATTTLPAAAIPEATPRVAIVERGARIATVTIETYGVVKEPIVRRYLSLRAGDTLEQAAVERDYNNLTRLGGWRVRLAIRSDPSTASVSLHWIVMARQFEPTDHPYYADQPLSTPIEGVGWIAKSSPLDDRGSTASTTSQLSRRANLFHAAYTTPLSVDSTSGRESDFIVDEFGGRGVYRASQPLAVNVYSWAMGAEALYLMRYTNGTQIELGAEAVRSTSAQPTYIVAPSLYDTYYTPVRNTLLKAGVSHSCPVPPAQWHPPYCYLQYRVEAVDAIGGLGANTEYRAVLADAAQYTRVGSSTLVLHGGVWRSGGVVPTSALVCATGLRGYAKGTCGTDADVLQAEYRIADARPGNWKFILFTETAASRVRGGDQSFAPPAFAWHGDSGVGVMYRGVRLNLAYGSQGGRLTYELQGQLF